MKGAGASGPKPTRYQHGNGASPLSGGRECSVTQRAQTNVSLKENYARSRYHGRCSMPMLLGARIEVFVAQMQALRFGAAVAGRVFVYAIPLSSAPLLLRSLALS